MKKENRKKIRLTLALLTCLFLLGGCGTTTEPKDPNDMVRNTPSASPTPWGSPTPFPSPIIEPSTDDDSVIDDMGDAIEDAGDTTGNVIEDGADTVGDLIKDGTDGAGDIIKDAGDGLDDMIDDIGQGAGDATKKITGSNNISKNSSSKNTTPNTKNGR